MLVLNDVEITLKVDNFEGPRLEAKLIIETSNQYALLEP